MFLFYFERVNKLKEKKSRFQNFEASFWEKKLESSVKNYVYRLCKSHDNITLKKLLLCCAFFGEVV